MRMRRLNVLLITSLLATLGIMSTPAQAAEVHTASVCVDAAAAEPISVSATGCSPTAVQVLRAAVCVEPQGDAEGNQCDGYFTCSGGIQYRSTTSNDHPDARPSTDSIICVETAGDSTIEDVGTTLVDLAIDAFTQAGEPQLFVCSPHLLGCWGTLGDVESSPDDCNEYIVQEDDLMICIVKPQP